MALRVPEAVKDARLARLQAIIGEQAAAFNRAQVGRRLPVLFHRDGRRSGQALGYSPYMQPVHVDAGEALKGQLVDVEIVSATQTSLSGRLPANEVRA
jgi:tRNA-2-methylthio-N6-dimethylallyladenosine synthase